MPAPLLLGVEPSVPPDVWSQYETQIQDVIFCKSPLTLTASQIRELATEKDQAGNIDIVPPRLFRVMGFEVKRIQVQLNGTDSYRYHFTDIVATPPVWDTLASHRAPTAMLASQTGAAVLRLTCQEP